tara:strand:+ start:301 stop:804 length:504 start_codon:yes stop_codon:yes gene_type:complete
MNIFTLDSCPKKSAELQHDKHVVKMILESAQILCSVFDKDKFNVPYRRTHYNHPCNKWARESYGNFSWLLSHAFSLSDEYTYRFGKRHKSKDVLNWCWEHKGYLKLNKQSKTNFAQAMPIEYKQENSIDAYKDYYINEKLNDRTKWTNRNVPSIFKEKMELIKQESV